MKPSCLLRIVEIFHALDHVAQVQRRIANAAQVSGGALKTNFFVQLCTLDHLLAAALQLSTQTNDGSASGRVHTRYAQSSQQRFDGATLAVQAVFAKARADINEFVQKTKRMSAATARLVAAAAREGSGTNTSTFVSPFRKRLRAAQVRCHCWGIFFFFHCFFLFYFFHFFIFSFFGGGW